MMRWMTRFGGLVIGALLAFGFSVEALAASKVVPEKESVGTPGWQAWQEFRVGEDLKQTIGLDISTPAYYLQLYEALYTLERYEEAEAAAVMAAMLEEPDNPKHVENLWYALEECGRYEEGLSVCMRWLETQPGMAHVLDAVRRAEELYQSGAYEESVAFYERLLNEENLPVTVMTHYTQALIQLSRYEEALTLLDDDVGGITAWAESDLLRGDIYLAMGDAHFAEYIYQETYEAFDMTPHIQERAAERLEALAEYAPPGFEKAFKDPKWDGYAKVAIAYYNETKNPSTIFALMRKGEHNVLCLLKRSSDGDGYAVAWENDKAVYQGDFTPRMFYDGHMEGMLRYEYGNESGQDAFNSEAYMFLCNENTREWEFEHMALNYWATEDVYPDTSSLMMEVEEGRLSMLWRYYAYNGSYLDSEDPIADMTYDADAYALKNFDIAQCNEDYFALRQQGEGEPADENN